MKKNMVQLAGIIVFAMLIGFAMAACDSPTSSDKTTPADGVITYTLSFSPNGATGGNPPASKKAQGGDPVTLPGNTGNMTKEDAVFGGWNTKADGTGTLYSAGSDFTMPNKDTTLYAKWNDAIITYTISFDTNGASGTGPAAQMVNAGSGITLPNVGTFFLSGYSFGGWNTKVDGTGANYDAGFFYTPNDTITLYAKWINISEIVINLAGMNEWELTDQTVQATANVNKVFTVNGSYVSYQWYLDGVLVGTSSSYTFNKPTDVYQLVVVVTDSNGESRSGRCRVTVSAS